VVVAGIAGATACNGTWGVTRVNNTTLATWDLQGSTFSGAYTGGGTFARKWDMDTFINTTNGIFRSDAIYVGNGQGMTMTGASGASNARVWLDSGNNLRLVPSGTGFVIIRNVGDTQSTGTLVAGTAQFTPFTFSAIASNLTANGMIGFCSDCTIANPCAGGGTGAIAKRLNGVNVCN
jgi:hypothetical protein